MTFKKGQSGNPAGRPPGSVKPNQQLALRKMCQEAAPRAVEILNEIIENTVAEPSARIAAIKLLFQYGYGMPVKQVEIKDKREGDVQNMTSQDIIDLINVEGVYEVEK